MDTLAPATPANALDGFCAAVISRYKGKWPPAETSLAQEFAERFGPKLFLNTKQMIEFAAALGINASFKALPDDLHGCNCSSDGQTIVILSEREAFAGSHEHTLFHELREVMEYRFHDQGWPTLESSELEKRAELFAKSVRMASLTREFGHYVECVQSIEETWKRWLAAVGVVIVALVVGLSCIMLPHFEKNSSRDK